jgi:hypothetical protein
LLKLALDKHQQPVVEWGITSKESQMTTYSYIVPDSETCPPEYEGQQIGEIVIKIEEHFVHLHLYPYDPDPEKAAFLTFCVLRPNATMLLCILDKVYDLDMINRVGGPLFERVSYAYSLPEMRALRELLAYMLRSCS